MEEYRCKNLPNFLSSGIKVAAEWQHEWKMDEISVTFTFFDQLLKLYANSKYKIETI
jgi:hypothetical protein